MSNSKKPLQHQRLKDPEEVDLEHSSRGYLAGGGTTRGESGSGRDTTQRRDGGMSWLLLSPHPLKSHQCPPLAESVFMGAWKMQPAGVSPP